MTGCVRKMLRLLLVFLFIGMCSRVSSSSAVHPYFSNAPSSQKLIAGKSGIIVCEVGGNPLPPVPRWKRIIGEGAEIAIKNSERYEVLKSGDLSIGHVIEEDAGKYVCFTSSGGMWMDKEIRVKVIKVSSTPLVIPPSAEYTGIYVFLGILATIIFFVLVDFSCFIFNSAGFINCFLVHRRERRKNRNSSSL